MVADRVLIRSRFSGRGVHSNMGKHIGVWCLGWVLACWIGCISLSAAENVVVVTWDGFRWQELFGGAQQALLNKEAGGVPPEAGTAAAFWRDTPVARREQLLPFFWKVVARQGQVFGDPDQNAAAVVTNGKNFSYPGYNELFAGFGDDRIDSNNKIPNPNLTVLEYLHRRPGFAGKVAAFATWDVTESILHPERSGIPVQSGWIPIREDNLTPGQQQVNTLVAELPRLWRGNCYDFLAWQAAREYLLKHRPRVLYLGLGETDEWAHARRYDLYLEAAQRSDRYVRELWELLQSLPKYRDRTALLMTTDHGRGGTGADWINHNNRTPGSEFMWIAVMGPGVPARGVRANVRTTQSQVAATIAQLVGEDFLQGSSQAARPLPLAE